MTQPAFDLDVQQAALATLAPLHVVVDGAGRVIHASREAQQLLRLTANPAGQDFFQGIQAGIGAEVRVAIEESRQRSKRVVLDHVEIPCFDATRKGTAVEQQICRVVAQPLADSAKDGGMYTLLIFHPHNGLESRASVQPPTDVASTHQKLRHQLRVSRSELEQTIQKLEEANAQLRDSEGRARALVEASSQMVWTTDAKGMVVEDSPSWRKYTGQTFDQWKGSGWLDVVHPDDRDTTIAAWKNSTSTLSPYEVEYRVRRADGQWRWMAVRGVPQCNSDGSVKRWIGMNTDITDRKNTETQILENQHRLVEVLKESEATNAKLQVLFDQSFFFAGILDVDGVVIDVNENALSKSGYEREEIIGRLFWDTRWWTPCPQTRLILKSATAAAARGETFRQEVPYWIADGSERIADIALTPARNEQGEVIYVLPTAVDVTERKDAEAREVRLQEALATKERRLSMAMQSAGLAAWEWSPEASIWDERLYEMLGISPDTPASTPTFYKSVHPSDLPGLRQAWEHATSGSGTYDHEFRIIRPDGEIRWLAGCGEFICDENGKVSRIYGVNWDITPRKRAEEVEKRKSELDEFLSNAVATIASSLDYETTLSTVTQLCVPSLADWAVMDLLGVDGAVKRVAVAHADSRNEVLATYLEKASLQGNALSEPWCEYRDDQVGQLIDQLEEATFYRAMSADDQMRARDMRLRSIAEVPLKARGTTLGVLTLGSHEPSHAFGIEELNVARELAARAAVAIDNARLFQAAQQANAAKSEFLANMSHEIRTPMTAILGYTELLQQSESDPQRGEFLSTIRRNGEFLLEIINDILDLSKIDAGKLEVVYERFNPRAIVEDVRSMMLVRANEKRIALEIRIGEDVPREIKSDRTRLRQILVNLVGNAIKFTDNGGVEIVLSFHEDTDPPLLQIDVTDTGIGIDYEHQKHLFTTFHQGNESIARQYGGTGLGLAISQRLAQMLGGEILVTSEPGMGSTFSCRIAAPATSTTDAASNVGEEGSATPASEDEAAYLSCNVLVVDDRRDIHLLAKHILTQAGATVDCAEDGVQAIDLVGQRNASFQRYDIILLDMQMPRMDGYQTASKLRELGYENPIIALTADAMDGHDTRCLESGCDAFLSKPIDAKLLIRLVSQHVSSRIE